MTIYPHMAADIMALLPSDDLINCRLVCKLWKYNVDHHLAKVTQVVLNEQIDSQSYLRNILFTKKNSRSFNCHQKHMDELFSFLQKFCPNLQVLSAAMDRLSLDQLAKVAQNLIYLEIDGLKYPSREEVEERRVDESEVLFPSLRGVKVSDHFVPAAFCMNSRSTAKCPRGDHRWVQSREICCKLPSHRSLVEYTIPPGTTWYISRSFFDTRLAQQLKEPSVASSLRMLELHFRGLSFDFCLPNLTCVELHFDYCEDVSMVLESLEFSTDLQVMKLLFSNSRVHCEELSSLIHSLKKLKSVTLEDEDEEVLDIELSLPPELEHLTLDCFIADSGLESQSVKYVSLSDPGSPLNFPNLLRCLLYFDEDSRYLTLNAVLESLQNSPDLVELDITFGRDAPYASPSLRPCLASLKKLERFVLTMEAEVILPDLNLSEYSSLRHIEWIDDWRNHPNTVYLEEKYESVEYLRSGFILKSPMRYPVKIILPIYTKFIFKYPLESTVTKLTIEPSVFPRLHLKMPMPQLLQLKVKMSTDEAVYVDHLLFLLSNSPNLQTFSLTHGRFPMTSEQIATLTSELPELKSLTIATIEGQDVLLKSET